MVYLYRSLNAEVAEWQTQQTQNLPRATSCGFDSRLRHQEKKLWLTFRHKERAPIKKGVFLWEKGAHKFRCVRLRRANKHKCSVRRNGRRSRLKICRGQLHVGSTPTTSTREKTVLLPRLYPSRYGGGACFFSLHKNASAFIVSLQ